MSDMKIGGDKKTHGLGETHPEAHETEAPAAGQGFSLSSICSVCLPEEGEHDTAKVICCTCLKDYFDAGKDFLAATIDAVATWATDLYKHFFPPAPTAFDLGMRDVTAVNEFHDHWSTIERESGEQTARDAQKAQWTTAFTALPEEPRKAALTAYFEAHQSAIGELESKDTAPDASAKVLAALKAAPCDADVLGALQKWAGQKTGQLREAEDARRAAEESKNKHGEDTHNV